MYLRLALITLAILTFGSRPILAQMDSLIFFNGNYIIGEVKGMDRGVVTVETDYSDSDFKIEWEKISEIYTETEFLITLSDGTRYNGSLSTAEDGSLLLLTQEGEEVPIDLNNLVFLTSVDDEFWSRLYANIDFGFSFTKANNFRQTNSSLRLGYLANRWQAEGSWKQVLSNQDSVDATRRTEANIGFRYFLPRDWYAGAQVNFLSNTEQRLDLRTTGKLGLGKFVIHTNAIYWSFFGGASFNNESFAPDPENPNAERERQSLEAYFGTEYNMYDVGDLSIFTKALAYPSLTESGRWRVDYDLDVNYDLPLDFYIKGSFSLNYDNRPVEGASETDYVVTAGFGWEW